MKKALMVATVASMIGQFNMNNIIILQREGYEVHVACDFKDHSSWSIERIEMFKQDLKKTGVIAHSINFSRNPFDIRKDIQSYNQLQILINKEKFSLIHCHTPVAAAITRLAAREVRKKNTKVIYTAHGFHFCKGSPVKDWVLYYPVEKWLAHYTDVLITINHEDYERAQRFKAKKIYYIPGVGIDTKKFSIFSDSRNNMRKKLGLDEKSIVLLSVGELNHRKNHKVVLEALDLLKSTEYFTYIRYLICGTGNLEYELKEKVKELGLENHVQFLGFREDISEICNCSDIFIFPSLMEGLPVALMEAMACGLPTICSDIRGNRDLIEDNVSGYVVKNETSIYAQKILKLIKSEELRILFGTNAKDKIKQLDSGNIQKYMTKIYKNIDNKEIEEWGGYVFKGLHRIEMRQIIRRTYHIPQEAIVLLSVGEISERKNHEVIIKALGKLQNPMIWFVICGSGALMEHNKRIAETLGVAKRLIFTGFMKNVEDIYNIADIFVFPSRLEGLGLAAIEAMAAGLPLITSNIHGINDYSIHGITGFSCDPKDSEKFAEYINKLVENKVLREKQGRYNQEVADMYKISNINVLMKDIYHEQ